MYTILISLLVGILVGLGCGYGDVASPFFSVLWGVVAALLAYGLAMLHFRRVLNGRMTQIQQIMVDGQKQIQARVNVLQTRPTGNPNQMIRELEKMQGRLIRQSLDETAGLESLIGWVPLLSRQIATMRMQFHYQLKEFDKVDELLPRCLMLDPLSMAMKLARMYRRKEPLEEQRKFFDRSVARLKYNQGALMYSLMAWILLQEKQDDEAHKVMLAAAKNTENDLIKRNLDRLANNRPREFSNAGLGDEWYALHLEQPKVNIKRQHARHAGRPF